MFEERNFFVVLLQLDHKNHSCVVEVWLLKINIFFNVNTISIQPFADAVACYKTFYGRNLWIEVIS